ncbi:MFS transporter, partial [Actinoplanes philippinensis]|uniref:MFS transporter n=1 Tax=Actinoplanes philippinensis TaxID=35752 RepID=UPI0033CAEF18
MTGPLSDRYGRRKPLVVSVAVCVAAGVACALAPTLPLLVAARLVAARLVQGLAGAGGMVIGRAVIADLATGRAAARAFTLMLTVGGVAPVLAPSVGGLLAGPAGWRGMLWAVALLSLVLLVAVVVVMAETRVPAGPVAVRTVARSRGYRAPVAVFSFSFAVMMAYIAASPFLYQTVVGLSGIGYGVLFGVNATGLIGAGAAAGRLARRVDPARMIRWCLAAQVAATASFLALAAAGAPA